jgi:transposase-like protein
MQKDDFDLLLRVVDRLEVGQRERLKAALEAGDEEAAVIAILESRVGPGPGCPHCEAAGARRWRRSHGLTCYRCQACARTFNALTGTPLARLRQKASWLRFAGCLAGRTTVREATRRCSVAKMTSFRWRHRFLRADVAQSETLSGIVEADETFFRLSFKGSRCWQDERNPPPRPPKKRAMPASKRGSSDEQVLVLIARDRARSTRAVVLPERSARALDTAIGDALPKDGVFCSDACRAFAVLADSPARARQPEARRARTWQDPVYPER